MTQIWLNGDRWNVAYLYDTDSGRHQVFRAPSEIGMTAGNASRMSGRLVATYLLDENDIYLQVGDRRVPIDGTSRAEAEVAWGGLATNLVVVRPGLPNLALRQRTPSRWLLRRADPTWDGLDELAEDSAAGIAALINSADARETYRRAKSPEAGPWHLLRGRA